ncbi:Na+/H+ antiporter subunit E [Alkaliflexus imshenetskii]|uniref:Na+/H+ antiporter subunit E n=1 Tax=Alkaliflexus imshenetskii TaxID=286730 RepID=UPI00047E7E92|nr:Na+/H+ antiporter subunit E [Alkaliflexus imshenetskii]
MKLYYLTYLFFYFGLKIMQSGWMVAWQVIKGSDGNNGTVIEYHTRIKRSWLLVLFFNLISMTPGALSLDLINDDSVIEVHLLDAKEKENFLKIVAKIESLILKAA